MTGVQTCALPICFPVTIGRVTANTVDDAGFGFAYGSCKILDMLGYGSFIGTGNNKKADITKQYLGLDTFFRCWLIRRSIMIFSLNLNGKSIWLIPIMLIIGTVNLN